MDRVNSARQVHYFRNTSTPVIALGALLAVTMVWGSSYPLTKIWLQTLTARQFLALRFSIGHLGHASGGLLRDEPLSAARQSLVWLQRAGWGWSCGA